MAETAVVGYLINHGWPYAERRALAGALDKGDVAGTPGLVWEVKYAGIQMYMSSWVKETAVERVNAGAEHGILVIKPRGVGVAKVGQWYAVMTAADVDRLTMAFPQGSSVSFQTHPYVLPKLPEQVASLQKTRAEGQFGMVSLAPRGKREDLGEWYCVTTLEEMTLMLRTAGFGTPLTVDMGE